MANLMFSRQRTFLPILVLVSSLPVLGQTTGRISGFVKDPTGVQPVTEMVVPAS